MHIAGTEATCPMYLLCGLSQPRTCVLSHGLPFLIRSGLTACVEFNYIGKYEPMPRLSLEDGAF